MQEAQRLEQLLGVIQTLIKTAPPRQAIRFEVAENSQWLGQVAAVVEKWKPLKAPVIQSLLTRLRGPSAAREIVDIYQGIMTLLHEAHQDLQMDVGGVTNVVFEVGAVFDYFEVVRGKLEEAREDVFIIDPYLDADFLGKYLPFVKSCVGVRLLTSNKGRQQLAGLLASAEPFCEQHGCLLEIRSTSRIHDRFLVIDNRSVFQSGSSFKDGARKAATNFIEVIDIAAAVRHVYEELWKSAKAEFCAHERSRSCTTHAPHTT